MYQKKYFFFSYILFLFVLHGCGERGDDSSVRATPITLTKGSITSLDGLVINGVKFKTTNAILYFPDENIVRRISSEEEISTQKILKIGMVVEVKGRIGADGIGLAQEILYIDNLEGKIENKTVNSMFVMGQEVIPDESLRFLFDTLSEGDVVEVSGLTDARGAIRATYLEKKEDRNSNFEIKGFLYSILDTTSFRIVTGVLQSAPSFYTVHVASTSNLSLADMDMVVVTSDSPPVGGVIVSSRVKAVEQLYLLEGEKFEVEGYVYNPRLQFDSFNFILEFEAPLITMSENVVIVGGAKADIVEGRKIEIEGEIRTIISGQSWSFEANRVILK